MPQGLGTQRSVCKILNKQHKTVCPLSFPGPYSTQHTTTPPRPSDLHEGGAASSFQHSPVHFPPASPSPSARQPPKNPQCTAWKVSVQGPGVTSRTGQSEARASLRERRWLSRRKLAGGSRSPTPDRLLGRGRGLTLGCFLAWLRIWRSMVAAEGRGAEKNKNAAPAAGAQSAEKEQQERTPKVTQDLLPEGPLARRAPCGRRPGCGCPSQCLPHAAPHAAAPN